MRISAPACTTCGPLTGLGRAAAGAAPPLSSVPQSAQNRCVAPTEAPHEGQARAKA
jgi:hypothetical protein